MLAARRAQVTHALSHVVHENAVERKRTRGSEVERVLNKRVRANRGRGAVLAEGDVRIDEAFLDVGLDLGVVARLDLSERLLCERFVDDVGILHEVDGEFGRCVFVLDGKAAERFGARIEPDRADGLVGERLGGDGMAVEIDDAALERQLGDRARAFGRPKCAVAEAELRGAVLLSDDGARKRGVFALEVGRHRGFFGKHVAVHDRRALALERDGAVQAIDGIVAAALDVEGFVCLNLHAARVGR